MSSRPYSEIDAYLKGREQEAEQTRQEWESRHPPPTKAELLARLETKRPASSNPQSLLVNFSQP